MSTLKIAANMDKAGIELAIKSITNRGASLDKDIALTGLSVLAHIAQHKEVSLFQKLYAALPKGSRSNALVAWALQYGQIAVNMDKDTKKARPFVFDGGKTTDLVEATKKPWFDFKKPKDVADEFNPELAFLNFMARIEAGIKKGTIAEGDSFIAGLVNQAKVAKDRIDAKAAPEATVTAPSAAAVPGAVVDAE